MEDHMTHEEVMEELNRITDHRREQHRAGRDAWMAAGRLERRGTIRERRVWGQDQSVPPPAGAARSAPPSRFRRAMPCSVFEASSAQVIEAATERFRETHTQASDYIHGRKTDPGFDGCGVLWAFAGVTLWPPEEPRYPLFKLLIYGEALHHAVSGLLVEPTQWLCDRSIDGFNELGASNLALPRRRGGLVTRLRFRGSRPT
jgi:hypothetical protein